MKINKNKNKNATSKFSNIFFKNNFNDSTYPIEEEAKSFSRILIENVNGDFILEDKILLDPHGLNLVNSIKKDGSFYFGPKLREVK